MRRRRDCRWRYILKREIYEYERVLNATEREVADTRATRPHEIRTRVTRNAIEPQGVTYIPTSREVFESEIDWYLSEAGSSAEPEGELHGSNVKVLDDGCRE
jgi:hypothetical protein